MKVRIALDELRCIDEADGVGDAEPYLWAVFFTVDGASITLDVGVHADLVLRGVARLVATEGSLGNLGTTDVGAGQTVIIPPKIHSHGRDLELEPISLTPAVKALHPQLTAVGGLAGAVVALMENDDVTSTDAEAAHHEFTDSVRRTVDDALHEFLVPSIVAHPSEADIASFMRADVGNRIADLVAQRRGEWATFPNYQNENPDDKIGVRTVFFLHQDFAGGTVHDINERFASAGEWILLGEAMGIEATHRETVADRSDSGTPFISGSPAALAMLATTTIVYRSRERHLYQIWRDAAGGGGTSQITPFSATVRAGGEPFLYPEPPLGHQIALYRGLDDHVHDLYWAPGSTTVGHENLTALAGAPQAAGNPVAYLDRDNIHHVIYRSSTGHLIEIWTNAGGGAVAHRDLMIVAGGAKPAVGTPAAYLDGSGTNVVIYRDSDGTVRDLYWAPGDAPTPEDVSGFAGTPPAVGDAVAYYIAQHDLHQIVYRAAGGELFELSAHTGAATVGRSLMQAAPSAPPAADDPIAYYGAARNSNHVIYRAPNRHLIDLSWPVESPTVTVRDLTLLSLARRTDDPRPAVFLSSGAGHIVYLGIDGHIYEITT